MLIDTHCHLDAVEFEADRDAVRAAAQAVGVARIVVPTVTGKSIFAAKSKIAAYPECALACGIHPMYVENVAENELDLVDQALAAGGVVAVGEIGLDHYVPGADLARQEWFFVEQLKLARAYDLPVILHVRRAIDPILKQLRRFRVSGGIAHAFNGSPQQAAEFIKLGFALGFGGAMTYSGSTRIRALAASLPLSSIVLETDAPDIPPAWLNRGRNTPDQLPRLAAELATLRGMSLQAVSEQTGATAHRVLPGLAFLPTPGAK